jgi:hypothetical protein
MFAQEVDVFNDINLVYLLEQYYTLQYSLKKIFKYEIPQNDLTDDTEFKMLMKSNVLWKERESKYCYIAAINKITKQLEYFTKYYSHNEYSFNYIKYLVKEDKIIYNCDTDFNTTLLNENFTRDLLCRFYDENEYNFYIGQFNEEDFDNLVEKHGSNCICHY